MMLAVARLAQAFLCTALACVIVPAHAIADDANLLVLEMRLDQDVVSDGLNALQEGRSVLLPLGELARMLTIAIRTDPARGIANGFVLEERTGFHLDLARAVVNIGEHTEAVDMAGIRVRADDIYVDAALLTRWLPLAFRIELASMALHVHALKPLPLQLRLARERRSGELRAGKQRAPGQGYPAYAEPYRWIAFPAIDQTLDIGLTRSARSRQVAVDSTTYLTGDLLGMEAALYLNATSGQAYQFRGTLARHDPDGGLFGPLAARKVALGNVLLPGVPNVSASAARGRGVFISSFPLNRSSNFDRHTLEGDLPPGWDVELYYNDALVNFQSSRPDGRYVFADQPLGFGQNQFRLVFHSPQGQVRLETRSFNLEESLTRPGDAYYQIGMQRDENGQRRALALSEWGIAPGWSGHAGVVIVPLDGKQDVFHHAGMRWFGGALILSGSMVRDGGDGALMEMSADSRIDRIAMNYTYDRLRGFRSEMFLAAQDPVARRHTIRLTGSFPVLESSDLAYLLEAKRDRLASGAAISSLGIGISGTWRDSVITHQWNWQSNTDARLLTGALNIGRSFPGLGLRGQVNYALSPERKFTTLAVAADTAFGDGYLINTQAVRALDERTTQFTLGLGRATGSIGFNLSASYTSRGETSLALRLFTSFGHEPRRPQWQFQAAPAADMGAVSARIFWDRNGNGIFDTGDEPLPNAGLTAGGVDHPARSDASGVVYLTRLPVHRALDIALNRAALEDPQFGPRIKGYSVVLHSGGVAMLDFPVVLTGDIDGTVIWQDGKRPARGIGDVSVELVDAHGQIADTVTSVSDGYYMFPGVAPGDYTVRVSAAQLQQLRLADPGQKAVTVPPDGVPPAPADLVLRPLPE